MNAQTKGGMVDIHCHMLPGLDDGADCLEESFRMAQMAVRDGISTVVVTPHQLGAYTRNSGELIREATRSFPVSPEAGRHTAASSSRRRRAD